MELLHMIVFGSALLLLAYLAFKQAGPLSQLITMSSGAATDVTRTILK